MVLPRGGHFLPSEQPDPLAAEYRASAMSVSACSSRSAATECCRVHALGDGAKKVAIAGLRHQLGKG